MALPTIETQIWLALKSRVDTLSTSPVMTAYDPGAVIDPPIDGSGNALPFILISDVRNDHQRYAISAGRDGRVAHARSGTLMLSVQWPITRAVTHTQLVEIGGDIAAHFPADTLMKWNSTCLRVSRDADAQQPYHDGAYRVVSVRVPWMSI